MLVLYHKSPLVALFGMNIACVIRFLKNFFKKIHYNKKLRDWIAAEGV